MEGIKAQQIGIFSLGGVDGLGDGRRQKDKMIEPGRIQQIIDDLRKNGAQAGDILLLLGSADCIATRPKNKGGLWDSNEELANARADWVNNSLHLQRQAAVKDFKIKSLPLPQHARCGPARNVRAVFPFLIHAENN